MDSQKCTVRHLEESEIMEIPWLPFKATEIIEANITPQSIGFEWGSGWSTIWFARHSKLIYSTEHDPTWYNRINRHLKIDKLYQRVGYELIENPDDYANRVLLFTKNHFDYILVDGINRNPCIKNAISRLKVGGMLILDNSNRDYDVSPIPKNWDCIVITGKGPSGNREIIKDDFHTTIWFKEKK